MADLALGLKAIYPLSKVIGTVHYMDWSLALLGNKTKLKEIRDHSQEKRNQSILNSVKENQRFLNACDIVIAISRHSYQVITEITNIPATKVEMIPHGIKDIYHPLSKEKKNQLRQ